ncbi:MAG: hypothetical protein MJZ82_03895 [Paludibacteraceae bacterium]|nr:hypothetical protein [Paludibacteraceae bacterium]
MFDIEFLTYTHTIHMAIKLVNALRNFCIEDNEVEIQKVISFLISNCGYKESQIDASLIIRDEDYLRILEYQYGNYSITRKLESLPSLAPEDYNKIYEETINKLIPNREPSHHTKYSAMAKKLMLSEENNEQIIKNEHASLRTRLMELFAEQKKWKKQLQEIGENMSFDDVRNQVKQANEKIAKHQEIIVECEECEKKNGKDVSIMVPIEEADGEYTIEDVVYDGDEPINAYYIYSIEHSRKRITFWEGEIAKHEQKLQLMDIAQQQLEQMTQEISDVNDQIKNANTSQRSEPLVEESSDKVEKASTPKINMETTMLYRTDDLSFEICQKKFYKIINDSPERGKQRVLRSIIENKSHFNPNRFSHKELANELNNLQKRFEFSKADVDNVYKDKNSNKR